MRNSEQYVFGGYVGELEYYEGTLIITGCIFGFDPTWHLVEGYIATCNEDKNVWVVTKTN